LNLSDHIRRYLDLVARAAGLFGTVAAAYGRFMPCGPGCDDCCSVYFQVSLIEAFYISRMFRETLTREDQQIALAAAHELRARFEDGRRLILDATADGRQDEATDIAARLKIPCPLNTGGRCLLYDHRPITCRVYGIPELMAGGKVVACPRTAFMAGSSYPTVNVEELQRVLISHSEDFLRDLVGEENIDSFPLLFTMPEVLITEFDRQYFLSSKG
jgi:Fe-S-cluster containining protein